MVNKWLKIVQQIPKVCLTFSSPCVLCLQPSLRGIALCDKCEQNLPWIKEACQHCGIALNGANCANCLSQRPTFERLTGLFEYAWPVSAFIAKLKYGAQLPFGKILGQLLTKHYQQHYPVDAIIPMPLYQSRQQERGFNQCTEIGRYLSKHLNLPLDWRSCTKIKDTPSQALLSANRRIRNVNENAFAISPSFAASSVLVIEDVVTTATTVNAFARALKRHGVNTVEILSVCRTSL